MPPKRRSQPVDILDKAVLDSSGAVVVPPQKSTPPASPIKKPQPKKNPDDKPVCCFGKNCKLTNPLHRKRYFHDGEGEVEFNTLKDSIANLKDVMAKDSDTQEEKITKVDAYKTLLVSALETNKIGPEEKRLVRKYQKQMGVSVDQHAGLLAQIGWTEDDYFDGIRTVKDYDVMKEVEMLSNNEIGVIWIQNGSTEFGQEGDSVFAKVHTKFFQTMSCAQGNYVVDKIGIVVNKALKMQFNATKTEFNAKGFGEEEWAFHGSSQDAIQSISKSGFLMPKNNNKTAQLDSGFFGSGIYLTFYSDYALFYSEQRKSNQMLLCQVLPGKSFKCKKRMDGKKLEKGYDSHFSPKGNEIVMFNPKAILPKYIIQFRVNDAKIRQQEG
ncbi:hypothetical protein EIN_003120 [Entamoeba invadens IP1]|uniref:PARP catalytic domain-containing protein n=1 Tax=Entamoeba invadens IP1 TaxID=370355 RepID=A0A0A1U1M4_ENTIV|nr:hypothetical protein EIN_003120 [Entamoeba invadens IP1]ELP84927.1 hypothetical protein EIN_003120 [Entamoeba invadens IP1]|eukprot:XP_004184273.1 hypothetical protein EIN_003120 [Entamoeba invadens IP1]